MLTGFKAFKMQFQTTLILATALSLGCIPESPLPPGTSIVKGTVLLDGSPLDHAKIVFLPANLRNSDETILPLAYGITDAAGEFELAYSDGTKKLHAGRYAVIISKVNLDKNAEDNRIEPWQMFLLSEPLADLSGFNESGELIPANYNRDSTLICDVQASYSVFRPRFELSSMDTTLAEDLETDSQ